MLRRKIFALILLCFLLFPSLIHAQAPIDENLEGIVTRIVDQKQVDTEGGAMEYQKLNILITSGSLSGKTIQVENGTVSTSNQLLYKEKDKVVVLYSKGEQGEDYFQIIDYVRRAPLYILFAIFVILTVIVSRLRGASSIVGMVVSFVVIFNFVLPQIIGGHDPVLIAILGALIIVPTTFYLAHGFNKKTHVAILSTVITLIIVGYLSTIFVTAAKLSGYTSDEASYIQLELGGVINMRGLLLAGIIISSLGILDDITISQSIVVSEIKRANKKLNFWKLFNHGMSVGHDHITSLVNTLILVYAGASLPLLLLFVKSPQPITSIINLEIIAEEIIKTLVGSIGLVLAVPITTIIAAYFFEKGEISKANSANKHLHK